MFNPKLALSLSFLYCGLGQLYKRELAKGIVLIFIYTLLVVSLILFPVPIWLLYIGLTLTSLLWLTNLLDAYLNTGGNINDGKGFVLEPILSNTIFLTACLSSIFLASFWMQFVGLWDINSSKKTGINEIVTPQISEINYAKNNPDNETVNKDFATTIFDDKVTEPKKNTESDKLYQIEVYQSNSKFYTLQVGAFQILENARDLYNEVTLKGYQAWIEPPNLATKKLYCVLIGEFKGRNQAKSFGKKLLQREGMKYAVVVRHQIEKIKFTKEITYAN